MIAAEETYDLALALEDAIPVILSGVGLFYITRMLLRIDPESGHMGRVGMVLVVLGGCTKVVFKIIMSLSNNQAQIDWLSNVLFWMLAPGFVLLCWALFCGFRVAAGESRPKLWTMPLVVIGVPYTLALITLFQDPSSRIWFFIFLTVTTVCNVLFLVMLIRRSRSEKLGLAAGLFLVNMILIFVLNGAASALEQTIANQWAEQLTNTASQAAFGYAAYKLATHILDDLNATNPPAGYGDIYAP